jgi:hypothetical protein
LEPLDIDHMMQARIGHQIEVAPLLFGGAAMSRRACAELAALQLSLFSTRVLS